MFRTAEVGRRISKSDYKQREPLLSQELLDVQQALRSSGQFPVIIAFAGVDGGGKGELVNRLSKWMDPRWLVSRAYDEPSDEERERPEYWRFWRDLPPKGRIGLFLRSWYSQPLLDKVYKRIDMAEFDRRLDRIIAFENALADDGAVILKFWMHLSQDAQKQRLQSLEKDPLTRWKIKATSWEHWRMYDRFLETAEHTIMRTSNGKAPFTIVEGVDIYYRSLTVGAIIRDAIRKRLEDVELEDQLKATRLAGNGNGENPPPIPVPEIIPTSASPAVRTTVPSILSQLDMNQQMDKATFKEELKKYQAKLNLLHHEARARKISTILVFEGPDAAGKGGTIHRITGALEASNYQVLPFASPTDEERAHHYFWRFWRHLARGGRFTIFDRSWYGRVLVERVEGFATQAEWTRAYAEINDFEAQLIDHGIVLMKYWLHVTQEEQLARFKAREQTPHKRWKLTDEDWRNREKWPAYEQAVHDMVQNTSTRTAPWTLVEGNDKYFARIKVLKTLCKQLESRLAKASKG
ncbi:MAG: polyphosphate:AMP phosphotransferase [Gammaproteobacteria bacterium]|nr:polyphosphate:AMP phosphotransferase [Gammaproteobacteria bacterium]MCP5425481.1 polyphosphate:AMP phosphotransferase [Gammaproteobacteria bacterium]MCP5459916.1 polyphosphate:AMP phosphotransferase [Gammaproteobacteria bacterium]